VLLLWGGLSLREALARARVTASMEAWLAAHPAVPEAEVPEEENAGVVYARILGGLALDAGMPWHQPAPPAPVSAEVRAAVEANAGPLGLVGEALARPRYRELPAEGPPADGRSIHGLLSLLAGKAALRREAGERAGALGTVAEIQGVVRQTGCFSLLALSGFHPLKELLEEPGLDSASLRAFLDRGLTPEEMRKRFARDWREASLREMAERWLEVLGPGGKEAARRRGWREPTALEWVRFRMGRPLPIGVEPFPSAVEVEELWRISVEAGERAGLRGADAFPRVPPVDASRARGVASPPAEMMAASVKQALRYAFRTEAWLALFRTAAAVRLYRMERGGLPARLEDLVPGVLRELPRDPFGDGPLRWSVRPGKGGAPEGTLESVWLPPEDGGRDMGPQPRARLR